MNTEANMNPSLSLKTIKEHPIISAVFAAGLISFGSIWGVLRPLVFEDLALEFVTKAYADEQISNLEIKVNDLSEKFDGHIVEFRVTNAFALEQGFKADLDRHNAMDTDTPGRSTDISAVSRKLDLATQYKNCLLAERPNCDVIQKQVVR